MTEELIEVWRKDGNLGFTCVYDHEAEEIRFAIQNLDPDKVIKILSILLDKPEEEIEKMCMKDDP